MMLVTDDQRSMMATLLVATAHCDGPCCTDRDGWKLCADIVGGEYASALQTWWAEHLGCGWLHPAYAGALTNIFDDPEQTFLERIHDLGWLNGPLDDDVSDIQRSSLEPTELWAVDP